MIEKLKTCPCCGGKAMDESDEGVHGQYFEVFCMYCGLTMRDYTIEEAHKKWNRRADAPRKTSKCPPTSLANRLDIANTLLKLSEEDETVPETRPRFVCVQTCPECERHPCETSNPKKNDWNSCPVGHLPIWKEYADLKVCPHCYGKGTIGLYNELSKEWQEKECSHCHGSGLQINKEEEL